MSAKDLKVAVHMALNDTSFRAGVYRAHESIKGLGKGASSAASDANRLAGAIQRVAHYGAGLLVLGKVADAAKQFVQTADAVTTLNNSLRLSTGSAAAAQQAYGQLFAIAQRGRVSFTELGATFSSLNRAGQALGISQQRMLGVTEAIANAMTIGGGSAQSMQAALTQLGQAMASGTLRGDELNSVMEQAPRLAQALAEGMGVSQGKLREMGAAGEITAERVIAALEKQAAVLSGEVAGSVMTVSQAWTQLGNAATDAVGKIDAASGASSKLGASLSAAAGGVSWAGQALANDFNAAADSMQRSRDVGLGTLGALASGLGVIIGRAVGLNHISTAFQGNAEQAARFEKKLADAEANLANLEARGAQRSSNLMLREAHAEAQRLVNKLREAKEARDALAQAVPGESDYERGAREDAEVFRQMAAGYAANLSAADKLLGDTAGLKSRAEAMADVRKQGELLQGQLDKLRANSQGDTAQAQQLEQRLHGVAEKLQAMHQQGRSGTGADAGNGQLANLRSQLLAAQHYHEQLQTLGASASQLNAGEREALKIGEQLKLTTDAKTRARLQEAQVIAQALGEQLRSNDGLEQAHKAHQQLIDTTERDAQAIAQRAREQEAANAVAGKSKAAIEQMTLAELNRQMADAQASDRTDPAYIASLERKIAAQKEWVAALGQADYTAAMQHAQELLRNAQEMEKLQVQEVALVGVSGAARQRLAAQRAVELKYAKELAALDRQSLSAAERQAAQAVLEQAKLAEIAAAGAKVQIQHWDEAVQQYDEIFRKGFADMLNRGQGTWKSFTRSLATTFKTTVADEIYKSLAQPFVVRIVGQLLGVGALAGAAGGAAGGVAGTVASAAGLVNQAGAANSILNGGMNGGLMDWSSWGAKGSSWLMEQGMNLVTKGWQTAGSSLMSLGSTVQGWDTALKSVTGFSGGLGSAFGYLGSIAALAKGNYGGAIGSAIGTFIMPGIGTMIGGVLGNLANGIFGGKVTVRGQGITGVLGEGGALRSYADMKKSGGLFGSSKRWTDYGPVIEANAQLQTTFEVLRSGITQQAKTLKLSADEIVKYTRSIRVSTRGLSSDQIVKQLEEEMVAAGEAMAELVLGTTKYQRAGESAATALGRLSNSLTATNTSLDAMGGKLFSVGLAGADMASKLVDRFGDIDTYITASDAYYRAYYSQAERAGNSTRAMTEQLAELGLALPVSQEGFRQLVSSLDLTTEHGRMVYATLLAMAPQFDETARMLDELARTAAADLLDTYTRAAAVAPGMQIAREAMDSAASQAQSLGGSLSSIHKILGDAASGVLTFGNGVDKTGAAGITASPQLTAAQKALLGLSDNTKITVGDLTAAQKAILGIGTSSATSTPQLTATQQAVLNLRGEIVDLQAAASGTVLNIDGLTKTLQGVDVRTFSAAITGAFELIAQRVRDDLSNIASERVAVREAAIGILGPTVMTPAQIRAQIAKQTITLPTQSAIEKAQTALAKADATVQAKEKALLAAQSASNSTGAKAIDQAQKLEDARTVAASKLVATYLRHENVRNGLRGEVVPTNIAKLAVYEDSEANMLAKLAALPAADIQKFADHLATLSTGSMGGYNSTTTYRDRLAKYLAAVDADAANQAKAETLRTQAATLASKVTAAEKELATARTAQSTATTNAQKAQLDYVAALQKYSLDSSKAVSSLGKLREETVAWYQSQQALAQTMGGSAASLRQTVADVRFNQMDTAAQFASLQERYNVAYSMAMSTTGETLASYGSEMNSLLGPLLQKAQEAGIGGAQYASLVSTLLARAEATATRLEKNTPANYQEESLGLLGQIDSTLAALEAGAKSSDQILTEAVKAGTDTTRDGLRAVIAAITGKTIPAFALGGYHSGGVRLVGERGPELEVTGAARYFSAEQTQRMLSGPGPAPDLGPLLRELAALRHEVTALRAERRADAGAIATNTGRTHRLLDRINAEGMPVRNAEGEQLRTTALETP